MPGKIHTSALYEWNCLPETERQAYYEKSEQIYYHNQYDLHSEDKEGDIHDLVMMLFMSDIKEIAARRINAYEPVYVLDDEGLIIPDEEEEKKD